MLIFLIVRYCCYLIIIEVPTYIPFFSQYRFIIYLYQIVKLNCISWNEYQLSKSISGTQSSYDINIYDVNLILGNLWKKSVAYQGYVHSMVAFQNVIRFYPPHLPSLTLTNIPIHSVVYLDFFSGGRVWKKCFVENEKLVFF